MSKSILVISHERSGTHFLIESLARALGISNVIINIPIKNSTDFSKKCRQEYKEWVLDATCKILRSNSNKIIKSHHSFDFFKEHIDLLKELCHVVYIKRHPLDVLTSCYYYFRGASTYPTPRSVEDLVFNINPTEHSFNGAYSYKPHESMLERVLDHQKGWSQVDVIKTCYENLYLNFEKEIKAICEQLDRDVFNISKPPLVGVSPRKGQMNDFKNHLTDKLSKLTLNYDYS